MKSLKDTLRTFVEGMPEDGEMGKQELPKGPNPTTYPGRPSWCGGAVVKNYQDSRTGDWVFRRVNCGNELAPGLGLCHDCGRLEERERDEARQALVKAAESQKQQASAANVGVIAKRRKLV